MTQWHANGNFFELTKKHDVHTARLEAQWYKVHVVGIWRRFVAVDDTRLVTREAMRKEKQAGNSPGLLLHLERVTGVEPASSAWKAEVLPLNHTRICWSGRLDSNQRPSAPKADALPNCATPRNAG